MAAQRWRCYREPSVLPLRTSAAQPMSAYLHSPHAKPSTTASALHHIPRSAFRPHVDMPDDQDALLCWVHCTGKWSCTSQALKKHNIPITIERQFRGLIILMPGHGLLQCTPSKKKRASTKTIKAHLCQRMHCPCDFAHQGQDLTVCQETATQAGWQANQLLQVILNQAANSLCTCGTRKRVQGRENVAIVAGCVGVVQWAYISFRMTTWTMQGRQ